MKLIMSIIKQLNIRNWTWPVHALWYQSSLVTQQYIQFHPGHLIFRYKLNP
jgi:hypothetical protein